MAKRTLDKKNLGQHEDWYGNNAAMRCPVCGKLFIVSRFIAKGQRRCPKCLRSTAQITSEQVTIEWSDAENKPSVSTRKELENDKRLDEFINVVNEGGAIRHRSIAAKLPRTDKVAFIERGGNMVAVAAIKTASPKYAKKLTKRSGYQLSGDIPELGYIAVLCDWRGLHLSTEVAEKILSDFGRGKLFATTSSPQIKRILANSDFTMVGREWKDKNLSHKLSLWIRKTK
jgi:hypothetical protein